MEAGKLRHRITIKTPVNIQDEVTGAVKVEWETLATNVPASIEPFSVSKFVSAQQMQSSVSVQIVIRWRSTLQQNMRIEHKGEIYDVIGFLPDKNSNREYVTLPCRVGVNEID